MFKIYLILFLFLHFLQFNYFIFFCMFYFTWLFCYEEKEVDGSQGTYSTLKLVHVQNSWLSDVVPD